MTIICIEISIYNSTLKQQETQSNMKIKWSSLAKRRNKVQVDKCCRLFYMKYEKIKKKGSKEKPNEIIKKKNFPIK